MEKIKASFMLKLIFAGSLLFVITAAVVMRLIFSISTITMPNFTGVTIEKARNTAARLNIELKVEDEVNSSVYEAGLVVSQDIKPRAKIKKGRTVYVKVSKGSKMVIVPDINGMPASKAVLDLKNADLEEGFQSVVSSNIFKENSIIAQFPPPGSNVPFNYRLNTLKSSGPPAEDFMMPDLSGKSVFDIFSAFEKEKIFITSLSTEVNDSLQSGTIISQSPAAGSLINKDTKIMLTAAKNSNDNNLKKRLIKVTYTPELTTPKLIRINMMSLNGSEIIYNTVSEPGAVISLNASVMGDAVAQVFIDNEMVKEIKYGKNGSVQ